MTEWLFDQNGRARIFRYKERFISSGGRNLAWIVGPYVYSLDGRHLGWFEQGVLCDRSNRALAFTRDATGFLPSRPAEGGTPITPTIPRSPDRPKLTTALRRSGTGGWSDVSLERFFGVAL